MQGQDHHKRIEERAYELWERAGRPEGRALEHWFQAEAEITPPKARKPRAKRPTVAAAAANSRSRRTSKVTSVEKGKQSTPETENASTRN